MTAATSAPRGRRPSSRPGARSAAVSHAVALCVVLTLGACSPQVTAPPPLPTGTAATPLASAPAATAGTASPIPGTPGPSGIEITFEPFAIVEGGPLAMAAAEDGSGRLFVASQDGTIWVVEADGTVGATPAVDLGPRIRSGGEQGLLGLALHPEFPADPRVFVDYTDTNGDTIVASLRVEEDDPDALDPDSHRQLLFVDQPYPNHNGGALAFGPDGYLYVAFGDGGSGGDPQGNGQRLDTLLGKILRLDVDGEDTYEVPPDNPFAGGGGMPEIWLYGLRNPWRMSFDRETGDLWIGDVGQSAWEEVDVARAGVGGSNFGWRVMEGRHCYNADSCDQDGLTLPASDYGRDQGSTVIGGYVYRGSSYDFLRGTYLFSDFGSGNVFAIEASATDYVTPTVVGNGGRGLAAWGEDVDGELFVLALDGAISRVVAAQR